MMYAGPYPVPCKRFYQLETLHNAIELYVQQKERFLWTGLSSLAKGAGISTLGFDLVYEDPIRLVYALTITTQQRKRISARFIVAKNHEECSAALKKECATLGSLSERFPEGVVGPVQQGVLYLPDRHRRKEIEREVFAYLYPAPVDLTPLYVASPTQLGPHDPKPLRYSQKDTERIKLSIIGIVAACYDTNTRTGIDVEDLEPESFAVSRSEGKKWSVFLTQCPRMRTRMPQGQLIQKLLFGVLRTGKNILPMAPARPEDFFDALSRAATVEAARDWCTAYLKFQENRFAPKSPNKEVSLPGGDYLDILAEVSQA